MIQLINTNIPRDSNRRIINLLFYERWTFGQDYSDSNLNKSDTGFTLNTYHKSNGLALENKELNAYAYMILDIVNKNSFIKINDVSRIFWNWYHPGSQMEYHKDSHNEKEYSIVYSIHDNDGGTEFKVNDEIKFYKSTESIALLFPSIIYHRGKAPKENLNRFNLNIVGKI
jgi:hypothetical protein